MLNVALEMSSVFHRYRYPVKSAVTRSNIATHYTTLYTCMRPKPKISAVAVTTTTQPCKSSKCNETTTIDDDEIDDDVNGTTATKR